MSTSSQETHRDGHVVHLRPEQVVEIAFDGLQRSTRYSGGLALRFARVLRYRGDKTAEEADTIETVRGAGLTTMSPPFTCMVMTAHPRSDASRSCRCAVVTWNHPHRARRFVRNRTE